MSIFSSTLTDYTNLLSQVWGSRWPMRVTSIMERSPLLHLLFAKRAVKMEQGPYVTMPFTHRLNPNVQVYTGAQVLNQATFQHTKMLRYEFWGQLSCQSVIPTDDLMKAEGNKNAIASLSDTEEAVCIETLRQFAEEQLHTARVVAGDAQGLRGILEFAAPASQTLSVGGITKSVSMNWFNQFEQVAGGFSIDGVPALRRLYRKTAKRGRVPDTLLCDVSIYDAYEAYLGPLQRLQDEKMAGVGYDNVQFKNCTVIYDDQITENSGEAFMLNLTGKRPSKDAGFNFDPGMLDAGIGGVKGKLEAGNFTLAINPKAFGQSTPWTPMESQHAVESKTPFHIMPVVSDLRDHGTLNFTAGSFVA
jgi:hypothetical protein